VLDNHLV